MRRAGPCLAFPQRDPPELQEVRRGGKAKIEVDAVFQAVHRCAVDGPAAPAHLHHGDFDRVLADPAVDLRMCGVPRCIARDGVVESRGASGLDKDSRAFEPPSGVGLEKSTSIMSRRVQPSPENAGQHRIDLGPSVLLMCLINPFACIRIARRATQVRRPSSNIDATYHDRPILSSSRASRERNGPRARRQSLESQSVRNGP